METDKLWVYSKKELFIPAEFSLLIDWCPILERRKKGAVLVYLQLQTGLVDEQGRSKISVASIGARCNLSSPTVYECIEILEELLFIEKYGEATSGKTNSYMIRELPKLKQEKESKKEKPITVHENAAGEATADVAMFSVGSKDYHAKRIQEALEALESLMQKEEMNSRDLEVFYKLYYIVAFEGLKPAAKITMKERGMLKRMIEEFGWSVVMNAIIYALDNWASLDYVNGYPSIPAIYGFRNTIVPESQRGANKKAKKGQFVNKGKTGVGVW